MTQKFRDKGKQNIPFENRFIRPSVNLHENVIRFRAAAVINLKFAFPKYYFLLFESSQNLYPGSNTCIFDNNRSLSNSDLQEAMKVDTMWFFNLDASNQIRAIIGLLRLGGGGLIFLLHKYLNKIYRERKKSQVLLSAVIHS